MAGTPGEESGVAKYVEPMSSSQRHCQSGEALAEWRSSDQVQNGVPSTSPPYWDVDDNDDCGPKPSELYGKHTWKIDKFSQINKRELRSNSFEVGGYKWYILIYPQGCDVCNHLSLFLCVANHDKLLPGWSHFAQFTISVVNKDPKKSKYSDTLHRFWKKEHDWGWKKFMELSKVLDGFVDADTLTIKAQVQVIRERADRPFRCLDCLYRRELVRVYLTNVEQICRRFVEERRSKLGKLIEDKARWASFCAFWMGVDKDARLLLSKDKKDVILRVVVKHFFVEKEVTSTLVMDSLYSGLKALECQTKNKKGRGKSTDAEELPVPIVRMEDDMFVLVDDVLQLLERAALEPLPPKDEKGPQNRTKDGSSGEDFNKDSVERDERRLTELGRRTIEIFILAHIFSKIEVAYKEAVAFERQEELIREEEAAWLAEIEQKAKRAAAEKEKKLKKKQGKQKRNSRKGKDKEKSESNVVAKDELEKERPAQEREVFRSEEAETVIEKAEVVADLSDVSDSVDGMTETPQPDSEDREASPVNWDTDTSEVHPPTEASGCGVGGFSGLQNGKSERNSSSLADDSSSTCSTDSVPSVVTNGPYRGNGTHPKQKNQKSPSRGRNRRGKVGSDSTGRAAEAVSQPSEPAVTFQRNETNGSSKTETALNAVVTSLQDRMKELEQHIGEKEKVVSVQSESSVNGREEKSEPKPSKEKAVGEPPSPCSPPKSPGVKSGSKANVNPSSAGPIREERAASPLIPNDAAATAAAEPSGHKIACPKPTVTQQAPAVSRPLSAPITPGPRPATTVVATVSTAPVLARSLSAAGRLGPDASAGTHSSSVPPVQSYRNAMMGTPVSASSSQTPNIAAPPEFFPPSRTETASARPSRPFETARHDLPQNGSHQMIERPQRGDGSTSVNHIPAAPLPNDPHHFYNPMQDHFLTGLAASTSGRLGYQATVSEEFPHLDIINDLLDDEKGLSRARAGPSYQSFGNGPGHHHLNRQFTFPGNVNLANDMDPLVSSCRYERTQSYHNDGYHLGYGLLDGQFDPVRDTTYSQAGLRQYQNGHVDPFMPNQWHMGGQDMFSLGMRNLDSDGYGYHIPDYPSVESSSVNGYTVFRPSNGH